MFFKMRNKMVLGAVLLVILIAISSAIAYALLSQNNDETQDVKNQESISNVEDNLRVDLDSKSSINQYGTAVLTEEEGKLNVELSLVNNPDTIQPVHIHRGTCDIPGEIIVNLTNVVNGRSSSVVDLTLDAVNDGSYVITGHRSAEALGTYDFCGVIE